MYLGHFKEMLPIISKDILLHLENKCRDACLLIFFYRCYRPLPDKNIHDAVFAGHGRAPQRRYRV